MLLPQNHLSVRYPVPSRWAKDRNRSGGKKLRPSPVRRKRKSEGMRSTRYGKTGLPNRSSFNKDIWESPKWESKLDSERAKIMEKLNFLHFE